MNKRTAKAGLLIVEIMAVIVAVFGAGVAFLYWRVERAPLSLSLLQPSVEFAVERRLPKGFHSETRGLFLLKDRTSGDYRIRIGTLKIKDNHDTEILAAHDIDLTFSAYDIFQGAAGLKSVIADGAKFRIIRNDEQNIEIPAARSSDRSSIFSFLRKTDRAPGLFRSFELAQISNTTVEFFDEASGRTWRSDDSNLEFRRENGAIDATLAGNIDAGGEAASFEALIQHAEDTDEVLVTANGNNFPVGDILGMFYGQSAAIIEAPISGTASISLTKSGDVLASKFDARIENGLLRRGDSVTPITFIEWVSSFDPNSNVFAVDRFSFDIDGNQGAFKGDIAVELDEESQKPQEIRFDFEDGELSLRASDTLEEPLSITAIVVAGLYELPSRKITLSEFSASIFELDLKGDFQLSFPQATDGNRKPSPEVKLALATDGALDHEQLLRIWPLGIAMGARDWIADRMTRATIQNIVVELDLPEGVINEEGLIPDEAMTVTFDIRNANAYYVKQMTPIHNGSGRGVLRGNSFLLSVDRASVGDVVLSSGEMEFTAFVPKWEPTYIRFSTAGPSEPMLRIINEKPLSLLSKINLDPGQFIGDATAKIEIMRPNKRDVPAQDYRYSGTATFENMLMSGIAGDLELNDAKGTVDLKPRSLTVSADASFAEENIDILWRQNFFKEDGPSRFDISGVIDAATADLFGVSTRQYLRGPVALEVKAVGDVGAFSSVDIEADFSAASATFDALGWQKPAGEEGLAKIEIEQNEASLNIKSLAVTGEGIAVKGSALIADSTLQRADFPNFYLKDFADLSIMAERKSADELSIRTLGEFLNAGMLIENFLRGSGEKEKADAPWGFGLSVTARINRLLMREDIEYFDVSLDLMRAPDRLEALNLVAREGTGSALSAMLTHTGEEEGPSRSILAQTSDVGSLIKGIFSNGSVHGGQGTLVLDLSAPERGNLAGVVEARSLHLLDAPLLARVFSAGSLDGLENLMNGEGIDFSDVYGELAFSKGELTVESFRATGSSVGITADGVVNMQNGGQMEISGAVAPIYQLNSAIGSAPVIGDILVGKKGEGILALSYSVSGDRTAPNVFINPLSALTPGIFRNLFGPMRPQNDNVPVAPPDTSDEDSAADIQQAN
ncbi:MAG: membrane protein [Hyphococcus sp.]|nr:MAG: membrane protein [Marinicaulis sp.]